MMFALVGEVNLWTFDDNINIKDTDFGAFRYRDKRIDSLHEEAKRSYSQKRGMVYVPTNKKGNKLKDSIKYLEDQLKDNSIIYCQWYDDSIVQLMLSNALLIQIQINVATGDIQKIIFDKYLVGKLSEHISDVIITKNHIVCTYNDNQVTLVYFIKSKRHVFDKMNKLEPKVSTIDLFGPNGRKLDKKIQVNKTGDLILIWWKSTMNEVYPWSPAVKEHDRANIHLYRLTGLKLELVCYIRSEFDPLCIIFDTCQDSVIHSVEQKVSRKGEVTVEWRTYEVSQQDKLQRIAVVSVPLPTHTSCVKFSPNQELLLLCCIDGSIIIYDQTRATTDSVKAAFIPTLASWHNDGIIFVVGNDKGQFQHFDISLSCIRSQILSEEATPTNILDLSSYFRTPPALLRVEWNKKTEANCYIHFYNHGNSFLLILFQRGPIGVMKVIEGGTFSGDTLVKRYLCLSQTEQATSLLLSMNWDTHPRACMHALNQILNYLFKLPLTPEHENLIQNALGSFHVPVKPISQTIEEEYGDEIRDLTRRFFHHLLRYQMFEKAFRLAIDLNDHDLFMDLHFYALVVNDMAMASAAKEKAEHILSRSNSCSSSHSTCSRASCSICSDSTSDKGEESCSEDSEDFSNENQTNLKHNKSQNYKKHTDSQIPPLPVLHPHHSNKNLLHTSLKDLSSNSKTDYNLVSTSFNVPSSSLLTTSFNHSPHTSVPNTFFASTSFNKPLYKSHPNLSTPTMSTPNVPQTCNNISDDLMTTSFGSISINEPKLAATNPSSETSREVPLSKSLLNEMQYSFDSVPAHTTSCSAQDNSFMSTSFNNQTYETTSIDVTSDLLTSSLDNVDSNIMSTSFSTLVSDISMPYNNTSSSLLTSKPEPVRTPTLKNVKAAGASNDIVHKTPPESITTNKITTNFYNTHSNLMSTSFNFLEDNLQSCYERTAKTVSNEDDHSAMKVQQNLIEKKQVDYSVPPPPSFTSFFTNYFQNLPRKNFPLSRSTSGLADIDESVQKFSTAKTMSVTSHLLQQQNSSSNIAIQSQYKHTSVKPSRTYRLNYDLDYIPFHGSCDNIDIHSNTGNKKSSALNTHPTYGTQSKYEDRHLKLISPLNSTNMNICKDVKVSSNIPPLPVITTSTCNSKTNLPCPTFMDTPLTANEKPKVKFSDTVTHILVPGTGQSYRQKRSTVTQVHMTDPKRELAESLPLCLGNEDYLKDFQPLSKEDSNDKMKESKPDEGSKIKVVHFGLL